MYSNGSFVNDAHRQIIPVNPASTQDIVLLNKSNYITLKCKTIKVIDSEAEL